MNCGSGFNHYMYFILDFQERMIQYRYDGHIVMIRVVLCEHGGTFLRLFWNTGITWFCSSTTDINERDIFYFHLFTPMVHWSGSPEDKFSKGLTKSL